MNKFRREFFDTLYNENDGVPDCWEIKEETVTNKFVEFNPIRINASEEFMYKILVKFDRLEITVKQSSAGIKGESREHKFKDPSTAATFVQGLLSSSCFIINTIPDQNNNESSDKYQRPLDELFSE